MFFRHRHQVQGAPGQFLSTETRNGLVLAAILGNGNVKVYASLPPTAVSPHEAQFPGGLVVKARGSNVSMSGGDGTTQAEVITPSSSSSV